MSESSAPQTASPVGPAPVDVADAKPFASSYYYAHNDGRSKDDEPAFAAPARLTAAEAAGLLASSEGKDKATTSKWNASDYHWEERDFSEWPFLRLGEILLLELGKLDLGKKGVSVNWVQPPKVEGECVSNIRKGKKILTFELKVTAQFTADCKGTEVEGGISTAISEDDLVHEASDGDDGEKKNGGKRSPSSNKWIVTARPVVSSDNRLDGSALDRALRKQRIVEMLLMKQGIPLADTALGLFVQELKDK